MKKNKKIVITILIILAAIFAALYTVELIDKRVNGEDYAEIKGFIKNVNAALKTGNYCYEFASEFSKFLYIEENEAKVQEMMNDKKSVNKAIKSCLDAEEELKKLDIPQVKSKKKIQSMELLKESLLNAAIPNRIVLQKIDSSKVKNEETKKYEMKAKEMDRSSAYAPIYLMDAQYTYSIKDILFARPLMFYAKRKLDNAYQGGK